MPQVEVSFTTVAQFKTHIDDYSWRSKGNHLQWRAHLRADKSSLDTTGDEKETIVNYPVQIILKMKLGLNITHSVIECLVHRNT